MKNFLLVIKSIWECIYNSALIGGIAYFFLALCNWSLHPGEWAGFSRFIMALVVLAIVVLCWDLLSKTIRKIKSKSSK